MESPVRAATNALATITHSKIRQVRAVFGLSRLQLGALLCQVHDHELWHGRARSFAEYLEAEHINISAAYQFMRVARRFVLELQLSEERLGTLATASMRVLDKAARVANSENIDDIVAIVTVLHDRDAVAFLVEMKRDELGDDAVPRTASAVTSLLNRFRAMTDDARIEFLQRLSDHGNGRPKPATAR